MPTLDIFNNDAFSVSQLSATITDIPRVPTKLGDKGIFREYGISTTTMMIERQGSSLKLVPAAPRNGVREPFALGPRKLIPLAAVHLPQSGSVDADEVQNVRVFGSETEVQAVQTLVQRKLVGMKQNLDLTIEYQRVGALRGQVLDYDGSLIYDLYNLMGFTQQTEFFNIATSNSVSDPKAHSVSLKRKIAAALGGRSFGKVRAIVSQGFFDKFVGHDEMKKAWALWNSGAFARTSQDGADFEFANVVYEVYDGQTSAGPFIPDGEGYAYPEGLPGMFEIAYAPAPYMETVNTNGLPYYAKQERMRFDRGVELESQSNPITYNTLPEAVVHLSIAAS